MGPTSTTSQVAVAAAVVSTGQVGHVKIISKKTSKCLFFQCLVQLGN